MSLRRTGRPSVDDVTGRDVIDLARKKTLTVGSHRSLSSRDSQDVQVSALVTKALRWDEHLTQSQDVTDFSRIIQCAEIYGQNYDKSRLVLSTRERRGQIHA